MLLAADGLVGVLVDALLLDEEHPQRTQATFEAVKAAIQRVCNTLWKLLSSSCSDLTEIRCHFQDFTEALEQLAVFRAGREALLQDPTVAQALEQVAEQGWSEEARDCARGALSALSGHEALSDVDEDHLHLMVSCECASRNLTIRLTCANLC